MNHFIPETIRFDIENWLQLIEVKNKNYRFKFCEKGNLVPIQKHEGLVSTIFTCKVAYQIGLWEKWSVEKKENIIKFITKQQNEDGFFIDKWLLNQSKIKVKEYVKILLGRLKYNNLKSYYTDYIERNIRAETRQNISTLIMLNSRPLYVPFLNLKNSKECLNFLKDLDWSKPWEAASHLSHTLMLISVNKLLKNKTIDYDSMIKTILSFLKKIRKKDGAWYEGNPSKTMKINGAMKVLSGLQWVEDHPFKFKNNKLIDLVLSEPFRFDGCQFTNSLFVLYRIISEEGLDYRKYEIINRLEKASKIIMKFKKPLSGFSFHKNKSQTFYYTATVSKGYDTADLHGTVMFTWACAMIVKILKNLFPNEEENWFPHKP